MSGIIHGDCRSVMATMPSDHFHAIVTDPPYEIGLSGLGWDKCGIAFDVEVWREALRVLRPGGHIAVFAHPRTYGPVEMAMREAGFEIRDMVPWAHGGGMARGMSVARAIESLVKVGKSNTRALRQMEQASGGEAYTVAGTTNGMLGGRSAHTRKRWVPETREAIRWVDWTTTLRPLQEPIIVARKPLSEPSVAANVMRWGVGALRTKTADGHAPNLIRHPKASASERKGNPHPTPKPVGLLRQVIALVCPDGGSVLDPFVGSGTTVVAARTLGVDGVGIEANEAYADYARGRVAS